MPTGTRPGRTLKIRIVKLGGDQVCELNINSSENVWNLHHLVRKLTNVYDRQFDLVHSERGAIMGLQKDYGSMAFARLQRRKLHNLRIRSRCTFIQLIHPRELDADGDAIPILLSETDDE